MVALESIALFRNLGQDELSALRSITREHPLAAGHEIFREGDAGNGLYFVKSGLVEISGLVGGNIRRVFSQLGPGEVFGEMAVIGNFARGIVHDLKNPLSIIGLSAEMFDMPGVSPEIRAQAQALKKNRSNASTT